MKRISLEELRDQFNSMLNEVYGPCNIAGLLYEVPDAWESIDPGAYEAALERWVDGMLNDGELIEKDGEIYATNKKFN